MAENALSPVRAELAAYSMFVATPAYQVKAELDTGTENAVVFGLMRPPVVPDPSDTLFTVPPMGKGRLDLVSQKFYGTPSLWWAVALCNPEMDPLVGPSTGDVIHIPSRQRLANLGVLST